MTRWSLYTGFNVHKLSSDFISKIPYRINKNLTNYKLENFFTTIQALRFLTTSNESYIEQ